MAGVLRTSRGASLRGSTLLRYSVKMSGTSWESLNGRSRLQFIKVCLLVVNKQGFDSLVYEILLIYPSLELDA